MEEEAAAAAVEEEVAVVVAAGEEEVVVDGMNLPDLYVPVKCAAITAGYVVTSQMWDLLVTLNG